MKTNKKLKLNTLKLESFITSMNNAEKQTILGQENYDAASLKGLCNLFKWFLKKFKAVEQKTDDSYLDIPCKGNETAICTV